MPNLAKIEKEQLKNDIRIGIGSIPNCQYPLAPPLTTRISEGLMQ
jgi:hypothetical protein